MSCSTRFGKVEYKMLECPLGLIHNRVVLVCETDDSEAVRVSSLVGRA